MDPNFKIGELLFQIIDFIGRDEVETQLKESAECHFLERLMQKPSPSVNAYWKLTEKLIAHPSIKESASETVIRAELSSIILLDKNRKRIRELDPEAAGQEIINNLIERRSPKVVISPLATKWGRFSFFLITLFLFLLVLYLH